MAYTFLQAVNSSLSSAGVIRTDLASFTSSGIQRSVNVMIRSWNDVIDQLFAFGLFRGEVGSSTLVLVTGTREYALAASAIKVVGNPVDSTNNNVLLPYCGGYLQLREDQPDFTDYTGRPAHWTINPVNGNLVLDATPTSSENGDSYTYLYEMRVNLTATTDTFPFSDDVVDALQDAVLEFWEAKMERRPFDIRMSTSFVRAVIALRSVTPRKSYGTYSA